MSLVMLASGCNDYPTRPVSSSVRSVQRDSLVFVSSPRVPGIVSTAELRDGERATRMLALALADSLARRDLFLALATSDVRENKLHLTSYLQGRGKAIREALEKSGLRSRELADALQRVRPIELYMPMQVHRSKWSADDAFLVALSLDDGEAPVAYNANGTRVVLDREVPPDIPTLVLAPVETHFGIQEQLNLQGLSAHSCALEVQQSLENNALRCGSRAAIERSRTAARDTLSSSAVALTGTSSVSANITAASYPAVSSTSSEYGLFATFFRIYESCGGECWAWGDPEYEVHIMTYDAVLNRGVDVQCAGRNPDSDFQPGRRTADYYYNQDGKFWNGRVMLLSESQVASVTVNDTAKTAILLYEDDTATCLVEDKKSRFDILYNVFKNVLILDGVIAVADILSDSTRKAPNLLKGLAYVTGIGVLANFSDFFAGILLGDDDLVGIIVDKRDSSFPDWWPAATHHIVSTRRKQDGTHVPELTGRATLELVMPTSTSVAPPPIGPVAGIDFATVSSDTVTVGTALSLTAYAVDSLGRVVPGTTIGWHSSDPGVATVSSTGAFKALATGSTVISANSSGYSAATTYLVVPTAPAAFVEIEPSPVSLLVDEYVPLTVNLTAADGTPTNNRPTTWRSSDTLIAQVGSGYIIGVGEGDVTVSVTADGITATAQAYVTVAPMSFTLSGVTSVRPNCPTPGWSVAVSGGQAATRHYLWSIDGIPYEDVDSEFFDLAQAPAASFLVGVQVSDVTGSAYEEMSVTVSGNPCAG